MRIQAPEHLDLARFPIDPWRLVEREHDARDLGLTETLFAVGNGYLGMRANPEEGRDAHSHGTFINGFHETWQHPPRRGRLRVRQDRPDHRQRARRQADEAVRRRRAAAADERRPRGLRAGARLPRRHLTRDLVWRTPAGKRVRVRSQRARQPRPPPPRDADVRGHDARRRRAGRRVVAVPQPPGRRGRVPHRRGHALGHGIDPRKMRTFDHRVLVPRLHRRAGRRGRARLPLRQQRDDAGVRLPPPRRHARPSHRVETSVGEDLAKTVDHGADAAPARRCASSSSSRTTRRRACRPRSSPIAATARSTGPSTTARRRSSTSSGRGSTTSGPTSDVELRGDDAGQQAVRWNLFQLAQASAQTQEHGIAAKGVTGGGYEGHYFWDTETYVVPFLAYTSPEPGPQGCCASAGVSCRRRAQRAVELNQVGALYPWRTITGEEASAYYAAGTAQYHINAAIAFALKRYLDASGDIAFLAGEAAEMLVETARLWEDLGFYSTNGDGGVPDPRRHRAPTSTRRSSTTTSTRTSWPASTCGTRHASSSRCRTWDRDAYDAPVPARRAGAGRDQDVDPGGRVDVPAVRRGARDQPAGRHVPGAASRGTSRSTPADKYPLLLHFHPLVIYRHQVLKQADVVLAMVLRSDQFPLDQKRRNFDYYDPITTGDSSLSACVQAMAAAQIGYDELADRVLPRGAVRRPRRHPRQRQRRRARGVGGRRVGHHRVRLRRAASTTGRRCASRRACRRCGRASRSACSATARA